MDYFRLQTLLKKDPSSYKDEFLTQWNHFLYCVEVLKSSHSVPDSEEFDRILLFLAHCSPYFAEAQRYLAIILELLTDYVDYMDGPVRLSCTQSLFLYMKKIKLDSRADLEDCIKCAFDLFSREDKELRNYVLEAFASYVRNSNGSRNNALFNNFILNFISRYCNELDGKKPSSISILSHSLSLMIRLFSKGTWRNPKVVNLIVFLGLRVNSLRLIVLVSSFLAGETRLLVATGPETEETVVKSKDIHIRMKIAGRSRKLERKLDRVSKKENKEEEDAKPKLDQSLLAIQMIDNPYEVAEKLIGLLKQGTIAGEHIQFKAKLVIMKALSRLVGLRKLILPDLYPFLRRYIQPHQKEVPQILEFSVQSVHGEIPDESVQELLKAISHAFIAEHCSDEVIASGICAVREICRRNNAIQEELLNEIAAYCSAKKDKIVKAAARGLVNLYRDIDPSKLDKKFRGRILSVRQDSDQSSEDESSCEELLIEPKAITQFKKKNDYESRVKSVMAGREGRDRFGSRKRHHLDKNVSKTNKVKSKRKPMAMRKARISKRK